MNRPRVPLARVDNRLIHGQVVETWIPALHAHSVLVADDAAAESALACAAMEIAVPESVHCSVHRIADARAAAEREGDGVLVLVRDIDAARRLFDAGVPFEVLNLGNVHFTPGRRPVTASVYLTADEVEVLARLEAAGVRIECRAVPSDVPLDLDEIRRRVAREA